ncbi:hypothetical protein ACH4OW_37970 [Streptomyces sp. NPDC017056]|uniref:hypothetical protein n=1 Tax=Streptomyces sp. NPDC017056 TaxID=3364973 RepID=UPI0037BA66A2
MVRCGRCAFSVLRCRLLVQPSAFGRPSPALFARADRGCARILAVQVPDAGTGDRDQDDGAAGAR